MYTYIYIYVYIFFIYLYLSLFVFIDHAMCTHVHDTNQFIHIHNDADAKHDDNDDDDDDDDDDAVHLLQRFLFAPSGCPSTKENQEMFLETLTPQTNLRNDVARIFWFSGHHGKPTMAQ